MSDGRTPGITVRQARVRDRTARILDAAAELLLRWGYKRVTVADIAAAANVGTGTLYLSWKTKEAVFESVLLRELMAVWSELLERMRADPSEVLLHRWLSALFALIQQRPLARALFTRDIELLGTLAHSGIAAGPQQLTTAKGLIVRLRELGLLRTDLSVGAQAYAWSALITGFALVDRFVSGDDAATLAEQREAVATTVRLAFEPAVPPEPAVLRAQIAPAMIAFLEQAIAWCDAQLQERLVAE